MKYMNDNKEQLIDHLIKELNLFPYQEYIVREIWESKRYLIPVRGSGWSHARLLLTVADILLRTSLCR